MSILVIDVGTSSVRAAVVRPDASIAAEHREALLPSSPAPGLVELDPVELASKVTELASAALAEAGPVDAVGIANQRASTDRKSVVEGKSVSVSVDLGGRRLITKKNKKKDIKLTN